MVRDWSEAVVGCVADEHALVCREALEAQLGFVELQEEYLKDEMRHLQRELLRAKEEITRIQSVPLVIGQFNEMIDDSSSLYLHNNGILKMKASYNT